MRKRAAILSVLAGLIMLTAIFASWLTPMDPYEQDLSRALQPPEWGGPWLGTDQHGRDMLSRVILGARSSVCAALTVVLVTSALGTAAGMISGYAGGRTDGLIMGIADVFQAFPGMVLAIAVAGLAGGGMINACGAVIAVSWPKYARLIRRQVMVIKEKDFIKGACLSGTGAPGIMFRHILPNITGLLLVTAVSDIGAVMMELAGLSFLGLGAMPPVPEWGAMMSGGRSMIQTSPWVILAPLSAVFITVSVFNLLGDSLRDLADPKGKDRGRKKYEGPNKKIQYKS